MADKTSGSQTCTISTEHTLATVTDDGTYVTVIDLTNAADGDVFELREYIKVRSSDGEVLAGRYVFGPMFSDIRGEHTVPRRSPHSYKVTLKQTAGTGRAIPWAVRG